MIDDLKNIAEVVNTAMQCDISTKGRKLNTVNATKIYSYICREITDCAYVDIGLAINKHHATILHHTKDFIDIIKYDRELNEATKYCMRVCRDMLGKGSINHKDNIQLNWTLLSLEQQKRLSRSVIRYVRLNKRGKNV
tara:strand:- start:3018 stop:3431 length:414 start_codon:yes stop_codon:yes gene_type:complete